MKIANAFAMRALLACLSALTITPTTAQVAEGVQDAVRTERARMSAPRLDRDRFLALPSVSAVVLSPDGGRVAWLRENGRDREVWIRSIADGRTRRLLANTPARDLAWTRDAKWLLLESPRQVFALSAVASTGTNGPTGSGIVAALGGDEEREFLGPDPVLPAAAIVRERSARTAEGGPRGWRLVRVDVRGRRSLLHSDTRRIHGFALDARGRLSHVQRVEGTVLAVHRVEASGVLREVARCTHLRSCTPLTMDADDRALLLRGHVADETGRELVGLMRLESDGRMRTLHVDPAGEADLDRIAFDPVTGRPAIAFHRSTTPAMYALDPALRAHVERLRARFAVDVARIDIGRGAGARWLIETRGPREPGARWHLYDPATGATALLFDDAPRFARTRAAAPPLPASAATRKYPVRWRADDGMRLHGFLTLPPGRDPRHTPLVVLVHGGPWNRARPDADGLTGFLANRGYAVFEPNFRGSTGYGRAHLLAPRGDFGNGRVHLDIVEGTRAMLAAGIGDPQRVGIAGASFGGYSTLLGVTFQPELFKVGVAFVPPPDFAWALRRIRREPEALRLDGTVPMEDWLRMLDLDTDDRRRMSVLHAQSPLANAARMDRPLLMIAGGEDRRVGVADVIEYAARLKLAGKDVSLLIDPDAGHATRDAVAREANLYLLEAMLHRHLGGSEPAPPDAALQAHLDAHLRLCGRGLPLRCVVKR